VEYKVEKSLGIITVFLSGVINEDASLLLKQLQSEVSSEQKLRFNFARVKTINSLGVRAWVTFLRAIDDGGREIFFAECVPDVIMQINMIPSFQSKAKIESFYVNYISPETDKSHAILIYSKDLKEGQIPPPPKCPDSGELMETEELEEEYFAFLDRQ
jgi:ABC-type transporter Mla MlaB component